MTITQLDESLRQFYAEARNKEGENYSRATLLSLRNGIERFLNSPPNNRGISLTKDPQFVLSNQMLDAKIKQLKKEGLPNRSHKPAIELEDLKSLKTVKSFHLPSPGPFWEMFGSIFHCFDVAVALKHSEAWKEFVVGSLLCSRRVFSGYSGFPLSSKTNISKFQFDQESGKRRTTSWMCYLQIINCIFTYFFFSEEVSNLMLKLKAKILCQWGMTKARKTTQAECQS